MMPLKAMTRASALHDNHPDPSFLQVLLAHYLAAYLVA